MVKMRKNNKNQKLGGEKKIKIMDSHTARIIGPYEKSYRILSLTEIKEGEEIDLRLKSGKEIHIGIEDDSFVIEGNFSSIMKLKSV